MTSRNILLFVIALLAASVNAGLAQQQRLILDLRGDWKFELGDDEQWGKADFDDRKWSDIQAPAPWEDEGYPGYDGYAWYRKHFRVPADVRGKVLNLQLGRIDDVDEVYLNGHFLGFSGSFPPHYETSYDNNRNYAIPAWCLNPGGDNVVAVRVYDAELAGGIVAGQLGIFEEVGALRADQSLDGPWKFHTGDDASWMEPGFDDSQWASIYVPLFWETQGYKDYDGFGWYRVHFSLNPALRDQTLILLVGYVDDFDETYLNGQRIGKTGIMPHGRPPFPANREFLELRAYTIPPGLLQKDGPNVVAVRVCDARLHGGIYRGPVGVITREHYRSWERSEKTLKPWPVEFFEKIFR